MIDTATVARTQQGEPQDPLIVAISPFEEDQESLRSILSQSNWKTVHCRTYLEAITLLGAASVVLCDEELVDGDWREVLSRLHSLLDPPVLIVMSRLADVRLWGEVLNLGGCDLLAKPFCTQEVIHAINSAGRWRNAVRKGRSPD